MYRIIQVLTPPSVFWPRQTAAAALKTRAPPFSGDDRCSGAAGSFTCGGAGGRENQTPDERGTFTQDVFRANLVPRDNTVARDVFINLFFRGR